MKKNGERCIFSKFPWKMHVNRQFFDRESPICIGSACHLKGSREVIQKLQKLVSENHLDSEVDLNGDFCSGNCRKGVCVTVDGELYSVKPETTEEFFQKEILGRLNA